MNQIGPNHIGVMIINAMARHGEHIMSMRLWPFTKTFFDNGLLFSEVEEFLRKNPFSDVKIFFSRVEKTPYCNFIWKNGILEKIPKISYLFNEGSIYAINAHECCSQICC